MNMRGTVVICMVLIANFDPVFNAACTNTFFGSNSPENRDNNIDSNTGLGYLMSDADNIINCCGIVDRWVVNFDNIGGTRSIDLQIWRPTTGTIYELVGENTRTVDNEGSETFNIPQAERITIKSGDMFGWWTDGADIVTYDTLGGAAGDDNSLLAMADQSVGNTLDWSLETIQSNKGYAIRLDIQPNNDPDFTNLPASTTIVNNVASGVSLYILTVDDVDNDDDSTLTVTMDSHLQFTFNTSTFEIFTGTISSTGSTELLVFRVVDQCSNTATATYTVTITNDPPVIHSLPNSNEVREDVIIETLLHTINVTDTGDAVTCSMSASVPASYPFLVKQIPSSTDFGIYSEGSPAFDYTTLNSYTLTVDCTDTVNTVSADFYVYLVQNNPPVIQNLQNSTSVSTTATIGTNVFTVISTDAEGDDLTYNMTCNPAACPFQIFASGALQVSQDLTGHTTIGYDIYISVSDSRNSDGPKTLTVTITDINDPVLLSNLPLASPLSITENTALATSVFTASYTDLDTSQTHTYTMTSTPAEGILYFGIDASTGLVSTAGTVLNYEALGATTLTFGVTISDTVSSDSQNLVINIVNENEAPVFSPTSYSLSANEGAAGASVGTPLFITTDPDTGDTLTYTMDCGTYSSYFYMDSTSGAVTYQSDYDLDTGVVPASVSCTVTGTDSGGLTTTASLVISIADVNDNTPSFVPSSYTFYVGYYDSVGTTVGVVTAVDADAGAFGTMTHSLDQASLGSPYFAIDTSGVIILQNEPEGSSALNYTNSVVIEVIATDSGGLAGTASVTIVVSDTTSTSSYTTTSKYKTFFDEPHNLAWFVPCVLIIIVTVVITCWMAFTCHGRKGYSAFKRALLDKKMRQITRTRKSHPLNDDCEPKVVNDTTVRKPPPPVELQSWRRSRY